MLTFVTVLTGSKFSWPAGCAVRVNPPAAAKDNKSFKLDPLKKTKKKHLR